MILLEATRENEIPRKHDLFKYEVSISSMEWFGRQEQGEKPTF
jgi:hypothetical protein